MITLDRRTRSDADTTLLDFVSFHERDLPLALAGPNGERVAHALGFLRLPSLAFAVDGRADT